MILKKLNMTSNHLLGKKDKRKIIKQNLNFSFDNSKIYKLVKTQEGVAIVFENNLPIMFAFGKDNFAYTVIHTKCINISDFNMVFLDSGAYKPLISGADVMGPGVFKYKSKIKKEFQKDDLVYISIEDEIIAVGKARYGSLEINSSTLGIVIDVLHRKNDAIDKIRI